MSTGTNLNIGPGGKWYGGGGSGKLKESLVPLIGWDKFLKVLALDMDCSVLGLVEVLKRSSIGLTLMRVRFGGLFWKGLSICEGVSEAWCATVRNSIGKVER